MDIKITISILGQGNYCKSVTSRGMSICLVIRRAELCCQQLAVILVKSQNIFVPWYPKLEMEIK